MLSAMDFPECPDCGGRGCRNACKESFARRHREKQLESQIFSMQLDDINDLDDIQAAYWEN